LLDVLKMVTAQMRKLAGAGTLEVF